MRKLAAGHEFKQFCVLLDQVRDVTDNFTALEYFSCKLLSCLRDLKSFLVVSLCPLHLLDKIRKVVSNRDIVLKRLEAEVCVKVPFKG